MRSETIHDLGLQGIGCAPLQVQGTGCRKLVDEKMVRYRSDGKYLGVRQMEIQGCVACIRKMESNPA